MLPGVQCPVAEDTEDGFVGERLESQLDPAQEGTKREHVINLFISLHITEVMLQYISYLQLCSNVLQNKLSRRQQKYIVNVYKTVQRLRVHFLYDYWLRSVSSYVLRKRNKMPKIKGKYTNHVDLTPLKTPPESLAQSLWRG